MADRHAFLALPPPVSLARVETLLAREDEVAREWQWLHDALNEVARARAEHGDAAAFRLMQRRPWWSAKRRVELRMRAARLEGSRH
jgi:hypothetical protein